MDDATGDSQTTPTDSAKSITQNLLFGLMSVSILTGMSHHMLGVALPEMQSEFGLTADFTSWIVLAMTLSSVTLTPLFGKLGDSLGKRRLLMTGIAIFALGTLVILFSSTMAWLLVGRAIQGIGTAGFAPLAIAIISQRFEKHERGKVLGVWNSVIPLSGLLFPFFGGLLVINFGWRAIYVPMLIAAIIAFFVANRTVTSRTGGFDSPPVDADFLRNFDWAGVVLLAGALIALIFYTSSRVVTGVEPLADFRLFAALIAFVGALIWWERRREDPYVNLSIFRNQTFTLASILAGSRMFVMNSSGFLMPLYLTQVRAQPETVIGLVLMMQAGGLFLISRVGGSLADRWGIRLPLVISMSGVFGILVLLALLPATAPLWIIFAALAGHGLFIGLSLAPLHLASMQKIDESEAGAAAGIYSMIRFTGLALGTAIAGVALQFWLDKTAIALDAYQNVFLLFAFVAFCNALLALRLVNPIR